MSFSTTDLDKLIQILQSESQILLNWIYVNCMQAKPDKFQAIAVGMKTFSINLVLKLSNSEIKCEEVVKLLGIDIDYQLNFDHHVSNLCRKAEEAQPFFYQSLIDLHFFTLLFYLILITALLPGIFAQKTTQEN